MFRYTPNQQMLEEFKQADRSRSYSYAQTVCRSNYTKMVAFLQHWEHTDFYSPTHRSEIPVNGILFPASFFDEQIV